ncbi:GRIM-19-like protein [Artemisia annua]|uniref:NADH dehydrogenase [ubiquinone] 1 alpha subcomplex subunit 13 n=1 Tax=Artemisia annua TaxID=35608 RepID=A0A2U1NVJ5_ARTAN|nr:GRIM-19-like protein [Artemisia annua]
MTEAYIRNKPGMSSVKDMPLLQNGPPPGGFAPVRYARRIPSKGPSAVAIFLAAFGTFSWGLIIGLVIYLTCRDPYSSSEDLLIYKHHLKTQQHGIDFYVKSGFNKKYPVGSPARVKLEDKIIKDYNETNQSECHYELLQKWLLAETNYPTPVCDDLERKELRDPRETTPLNP